jgi:hypothetical protein
VTVPAEFDFNRSERGKYLNTKGNVEGVMILNGIKCAYNVIKKRMEIFVPDSSSCRTQTSFKTCKKRRR